MNKDREMRDAKGNIMHLEKPGLGVLIRGGKVVNEENYAIFVERQKQNTLAPKSTDPALAEQVRKQEAEILAKKDERINKIEEKVDGMSDTLQAILNKLNEKN